MLALFVTKVLRPPPARIGQFGKFTFPRAVPWTEATGCGAGVVGGLALGGAMFGGFGAMLFAAAGGFGGVWIVVAKPWRGENIAKVGMVKVQAWRKAVRMQCPGSYLPVATDQAASIQCCAVCDLICDVVEDEHLRVAAPHEWKREIYIGCQPVRPDIREIRMIPGSVEIEHLQAA